MNINNLRTYLYNELMNIKTRDQLLSCAQSLFLKYEEAFTVTVAELELLVNSSVEHYPFDKNEYPLRRMNITMSYSAPGITGPKQ